jgi:hypothetical protein
MDNAAEYAFSVIMSSAIDSIDAMMMIIAV